MVKTRVIPTSSADDAVQTRSAFGGRMLRIGITLAAAVAIAVAVDLGEALGHLGKIGREALVVAFVLLAAQSIVAAWRWHALLQSVGADTRFARDFQIYMSASVANLAFLPQIGSLSVRTYLIVRDGVGLGPAIGSLMLERLFVLATLAVAFGLGAAVLSDRISGLEAAGFLAVGAGGILAALLASSLIMRLIARGHFDSGVGRLKELARQPRRAVALVLSSLFVLYSGFAAVAVIAMGLNTEVPWLLFFAIQPFVAVLAALPISVGGWGVREGGMVVSLGMVGVNLEHALAISIAAALASCVTTLALAAAAQGFQALRWSKCGAPSSAETE